LRDTIGGTTRPSPSVGKDSPISKLMSDLVDAYKAEPWAAQAMGGGSVPAAWTTLACGHGDEKQRAKSHCREIHPLSDAGGKSHAALLSGEFIAALSHRFL